MQGKAKSREEVFKDDKQVQRFHHERPFNDCSQPLIKSACPKQTVALYQMK